MAIKREAAWKHVASLLYFERKDERMIGEISDTRRGPLDQLKAENAKLRELAVLLSVIFKHMSTCPTTDCKVCPVSEECAESVYLEGVLGIDDKETSWRVQCRSKNEVG